MLLVSWVSQDFCLKKNEEGGQYKEGRQVKCIEKKQLSNEFPNNIFKAEDVLGMVLSVCKLGIKPGWIWIVNLYVSGEFWSHEQAYTGSGKPTISSTWEMKNQQVKRTEAGG